jgi:hypothetical protein
MWLLQVSSVEACRRFVPWGTADRNQTSRWLAVGVTTPLGLDPRDVTRFARDALEWMGGDFGFTDPRIPDVSDTGRPTRPIGVGFRPLTPPRTAAPPTRASLVNRRLRARCQPEPLGYDFTHDPTEPAERRGMPSTSTEGGGVHRVTSVGGGVAGKLGDRYEAWWTILEGVLPVLDGHFDALYVEEPGTDAIEFRLEGAQDDRPDEVHQCKNSDDTSWTVKRLHDEGFLVEVARQTDRGRLVRFVSSSTSVLARMSKKARMLTFTTWEQDLNQKESRARDDLLHYWATTADIVYRRLRRSEFRNVDDETLRDILVGQVDKTMEGDPEEAIGFIRGFIERHFGENPITAHELWADLRKLGHSPRLGTDTAITEKLRDLVDTYVDHVDDAKPLALQWVERAEVDLIVDRLTAEEGPAVVAVVGRPGTGKSSVLAQVCRRLRDSVVVGVLRLDLASPATTAAALGKQEAMGFGDAPSVAMIRAGAGRGAVLVIDQVDSVSSLSGRDSSLISALRQVVTQARTTGNVRLLVACRSEDLRYDGNLKRALGLSPLDRPGGASESAPGVGTSDSIVEQVELAELSAEQVSVALGQLRIEYQWTPLALRALLSNALNLALFTELYTEADEHERESLTAIRTKLDLVARYHEYVARQLRNSPGGSAYPRVAITLARSMSDLGALSAPESVLAEDLSIKDLMIHHGVLIREGRRLRFVHETLFEYLVAVGIQQQNTTVVQLLQSGQQELLRSGQVRALLALIRDEGDERAYVADLQAALDGKQTRSHIRAAVCSMLRENRTAGDAEFQVVFERATDSNDKMRFHARRTLAAPAFAAIMARRQLTQFLAMRLSGQPPSAAGAHQQALARLEEGETQNVLIQLAQSSPDITAAAAHALASDLATFDRTWQWLLRIAFMAGPTDSGRDIADLFIAVFESITEVATTAPPPNFTHTATQYNFPDIDAYIRRIVYLAFNEDGRHALSTIAKRAPLHAARAIGAWLAAAERISIHHDISSIFAGYGDDTPLRHEATGLSFLEGCARATPLQYVETVLPILVRDWNRNVRSGADWRPVGVPDSVPGLRTETGVFSYGRRSLRQEVFDALRIGLGLAAQAEPDATRAILRPLHDSDLYGVQDALASAYEHATGSMLADAADWCAGPRVRGLDRQFAPGWSWGAVLCQIAAADDPALRNKAFDLLEETYPSKGVSSDLPRASMQEDQWGRRTVLGQLSRRLGPALPAPRAEELRILEGLFGPAPMSPEPEELNFRPRHTPDDPPSDDSSDQQWIDAINAVHLPDGHDDGDDEPDDLVHATVDVLVTASVQQAKADPGRFARILRSSTGAPTTLANAIVNGIVEAADPVDNADRASIVDLIGVLEAQDPAVRDDRTILSLIHRCGRWPLPDAVVNLVPRIFDRAPSTAVEFDWPGSDRIVVAGLNRVRGQAANTAGFLLFAPEHQADRLPLLRSLLRRIVLDADAAVRVFGPQALLAALAVDPGLFEWGLPVWLGRASDAVMHAPNLGQATWAAARLQPALAGSIVQRMLSADDDAVRRRGGNLATLCALRGVQIGTDDPYQLEAALGDARSRRGVAVFLAQMVDELSDADPTPPHGRAIVNMALLYQLADDEDEGVRSEVANVLRYTNAPLTRHADTFRRLAQTRAFVDHPGNVLHVLSQRQDVLPESVLDLCQAWARWWAATAGDISKREAADGYYAVQIVLTVYTHAAAGSSIRVRCLDLIDQFIENGVGNADAMIEQAAYQTIVDYSSYV